MKMASPAGFEPTAPGLGILCSIQLSYGDPAVLYHGHAAGVSSQEPPDRPGGPSSTFPFPRTCGEMAQT
ncbi:MAG: hypothetical protein RL477_429 [Pseudomonadota bacterium]